MITRNGSIASFEYFDIANSFSVELAYEEMHTIFDNIPDSFPSPAMETVEIGASKIAPAQKDITTTTGKVGDFIEKVLGFLKRIKDAFMEKLTSIFDDEYDWFQKNDMYIKDFPPEVARSLSLSAIPYWAMGGGKVHDRLAEDKMPFNTSNFDSLAAKIRRNSNSGNVDIEMVFKEIATPELAGLSKNPREAIRMYYLGEGERQTGMTEFKGNAAVDAVKEMRAFISTYKQTYVASYERMNKTVENNLNAVKKNLARLKSQGATEALNAVYDALSSVLEDAAIATVSNAEDKKNQQEAKAHKNINKKNGLTDEEKTARKNDASQQITNDTYIEEKIIKKMVELQGVVVAARLTALRTIKDHYMTILQQVVDAVKQYRGVKQTDANNKTYNANKRKLRKEAIVNSKTTPWGRMWARLSN